MVCGCHYSVRKHRNRPLLTAPRNSMRRNTSLSSIWVCWRCHVIWHRMIIWAVGNSPAIRWKWVVQWLYDSRACSPVISWKCCSSNCGELLRSILVLIREFKYRFYYSQRIHRGQPTNTVGVVVLSWLPECAMQFLQSRAHGRCEWR